MRLFTASFHIKTVQQQLGQQQQQPFSSQNISSGIDDLTRQKYLEEEKERLRQYEEQRRKQMGDGAPGALLIN